MTGIVVLDFKPIGKGALVGFATAQMPSGIVIHDIAILRSATGTVWASPPAKPQLDRMGVALRDPNGKMRYAPVLSFATKKLGAQFSDLIIAALERAAPNALAGEAAP